MRSTLVLALFACLALHPALAQHTTGEGNAIDQSGAKVTDMVKPGASGAATVTDQSATDQKSMAVNPARPTAGGLLSAACKPEGSSCAGDGDCCTGACKPAAEARVCVPKND
jgi:expansin (peptidoglycan-binding protein)